MLDDTGTGSGMYAIPADGRRFRELELRVKQKRMNKTVALHPLDQFRAFQVMREKGHTE